MNIQKYFLNLLSSLFVFYFNIFIYLSLTHTFTKKKINFSFRERNQKSTQPNFSHYSIWHYHIFYLSHYNYCVREKYLLKNYYFNFLI